jgi:hypothetical protein
MPREFFDPTPEEQVIVLVEREAIRKAERFIKSCEQCDPEAADWPFTVLLDHFTGSDPRVTDYILEAAARCPNCRRNVFEATLIEPA